MARIKIKDLPRDLELTKEEIKKVTGGALDGHALDLQATDSLLDARSERLQRFSQIDRFILPNAAHDAGP